MFLRVASMQRRLTCVAVPLVREALVGGSALRSLSRCRGAGSWRLSFTMFCGGSTLGPQMHGVMLVLACARAGNNNCVRFGIAVLGLGAGCVCFGAVRACGCRWPGLPEGVSWGVRLTGPILSHGPCPPAVGGHIL